MAFVAAAPPALLLESEPPPARQPRLTRQPGLFFVRASGHAAVTLLALLGLAPILWMLYASFRPGAELFSLHHPASLSLEEYRSAIEDLPLAHLFLNTVLMATCVAAAQLFTGLLAAYGLARWRLRGERLVLLLLVASWLVPFQVTMLPNYVLLAKLGLLNSVGGVILPQLTSAYAVLLLRQHLRAFPRELIDAARIDGRRSWPTLWLVVVPNIAPALAALAILLFVSGWNEYFWPLLVFHTPNAVLQIGVANLLDQASPNYGALMAVSGLSTVPLLVLYGAFQRRIVSAFVRTGFR